MHIPIGDTLYRTLSNYQRIARSQALRLQQLTEHYETIKKQSEYAAALPLAYPVARQAVPPGYPRKSRVGDSEYEGTALGATTKPINNERMRQLKKIISQRARNTNIRTVYLDREQAGEKSALRNQNRFKLKEDDSSQQKRTEFLSEKTTQKDSSSLERQQPNFGVLDSPSLSIRKTHMFPQQSPFVSDVASSMGTKQVFHSLSVPLHFQSASWSK